MKKHIPTELVTGEVRARFVSEKMGELIIASDASLVDLAHSKLVQKTRAAIPDPLRIPLADVIRIEKLLGKPSAP